MKLSLAEARRRADEYCSAHALAITDCVELPRPLGLFVRVGPIANLPPQPLTAPGVLGGIQAFFVDRRSGKLWGFEGFGRQCRVAPLEASARAGTVPTDLQRYRWDRLFRERKRHRWWRFW